MGRIALVGAAAAFLAAATGFAFAAANPWLPHRAEKRFTIAGHVDNLLPGKRSRLSVKVRNPMSRTIRVRSIAGQVGPSGRPCPFRNVLLGRFRGSLIVPPRSTRTVSLRASLRRSAPPTCAGATFSIRFFGTAVVR